MSKYIFVTGGVVSSLGKGITAASLGCLLKSRGFKVSIQKLDPYINYNPGNMSPFQHGEVFVTEDGAETDLDLGHYERFIDENLTEKNNYTAGKIYWSIIRKESEGEYEGVTVQVIPHVTNEIKKRIKEVNHENQLDVLICEVGGTVGDIESLPFLEAIRQMKTDVGKENVIYIHVTLMPFLPSTEELKTKPTQHSVKELRSIGIQPDIIVCRSEHALSQGIKDKIALFCDIQPHDVIVNFNADSTYEVPLLLQKEGIDEIVAGKLMLEGKDSTGKQLEKWQQTVEKLRNLEEEVKIALIGKYVSLKDAYLSISEALDHAGTHRECRVSISWIEDELLEKEEPEKILKGMHGVIIPGGINEGASGLEAKIKAVNWARLNEVPFMGINVGMHSAVVEFVRNECGWKGVNSVQVDPETPHPVIVHLEQPGLNGGHGIPLKGAFNCELNEGGVAYTIYGKDCIKERCHHSYVLNPEYVSTLGSRGMVVSGSLAADNRIPLIVELLSHPWFVSTQFHPEFKSRPLSPHPLLCDFIEASRRKNKGKIKK